MVQKHAHQIWKLGVEVQSSGRSSPMVRTIEALKGNYLQRTCDRPDDVPSHLDEALKQEIFPSKFSKNLVVQLSVRMAHVHRLDGAQVYFS
jgi:hypothetical protein